MLENWPSNIQAPIVPTRIITRPPSPETEQFESISEGKFQDLSKAGAFALQWKSYDIYYGVKAEIEDSLSQGRSVLVNVSRKIVNETRTRFPNVCVIFIKVPFHITEARIRARGREEGSDLDERLERARKNQDFPSADYVVDNSSDLENAGRQLLKILLEN